MSRNGKRSDVAPPGWLRWVAWALGLAAVVGPLLAPNVYWIGVMARICLYATLALGLNVVVRFAGLLALGYVAFFGIGSCMFAFPSPVASWLDLTLVALSSSRVAAAAPRGLT